MGYFDDLLEEEPVAEAPKRRGYFDDLLDEEDTIPASQPKPTKLSPWDTFQPKPKEVGTLEGIANAARNAFDSSRQAMDVVGGVTPEEAKNISKIEYDKQSRKLAPGYDEYQKAEGMDAVWAFAKNPIEVTSNIIAEGLAGSLPALGAGLAAGGAGALIGAPTGIGAPIGFTAGQIAGTFAGSLATEYGGKILEEMQNEGMDIQDPDSIQKFFSNQTLVDAAKDKALKRGVPIAAFDAISAGIGGKLGRVIGKQFVTKTGEAAAELGVQAGLGGAGAVVGPLAAGEAPEGKEVFGEIIGETGGGISEIVTGRIADRQARLKAQEDAKIKAASELSTTLEENSAPLTAAAVKSTTATTIEQDKLAAQLEEQLDAEELVAVKEPTAAPPTAIPTKDDYVARYSAIAQVAPEELTRAEQSFTSELATADTEEKRTNAQNALEAIKEVKATVTPPAPQVEPTITPAVTPAAEAAQPTETYAAEEIIQPEGVRQEPQDGTQVRPTEEAGVGYRLQPPARGEEEGQVIFGLRSVADNTATREQISALSEAGLVDIVKGKPVINEDGAAILAQPAAPAIVEQEPVTTPAPEEAVTPAPIAEAPIVSEEGAQVSEITPAPTIAEAAPVEPTTPAPTPQLETGTIQTQPFQVTIPDATGQRIARMETIEIPMEWDAEINDWLMTEEGSRMVDETKQKGIAEQKKTTPKTYAQLENEALDIQNQISTEAGVSALIGVSDDNLTISGLESREKGKGTKALEIITSAADKNQTTITLKAEPKSGDVQRLKKLYSRFGFVDDPNFAEGSNRMIRFPTATPAPVTEQAAPAKAPAPEVASIQRDVTKPEQMTPEERGIQGHKLVIEQARKDFELAKTGQTFGFSGGQTYKSKAAAIKDTKSTFEKMSQPTEADIKRGASDHYGEINRAISDNNPVSASAVESYGINLPEGYAKQGDLYVYQPIPAVSETITPAEAPAPEVAPAERVEMPKDFEITGKKITKISTENGIESATKDYASALNKKGIKTEISYDVTTTIGFDTVTKTKKRITSNDNVSSGNIITPQGKLVILSDGSVNVFKPIPPTPAVSEKITEPAQPTGIAVGNRVKLGKSPQTYTIEEVIPQSANDKKFGEQYYNVKNEKTGETQVVEKNDMKPVNSKRRKMAAEPEPLPENERYGQVKLNRRIQKYFGGKIPDKVYVVDNTDNKEYQYKAAYYPDLGILVVNNAYVRKGENVGDIIAHELGHYAFGDKKFKDAFDTFYNSLSQEDKAKIDNIIEDSYNEETEESKIEERNVIAFTAYTIVNPQRRSLWNAVLDALKAFANKVFGKNFQMSDPNRTALAMLATAKRRFAAGEEIVREDIQARKMAAQTQDARFAELEARAKAGDKEAEAEAQRMVDEAARAGGYDSENLLFHGTTHIFNVFKKDRANIENDLGKGYYFTNTENDAQVNYAGEGPDLTNRIERLAEQLESNEEIPREEAISKAKEILSGGEQKIINAYLKLDNPFVIGSPNETFLDYNENYDPETEEYGEPSGKLLEFIENFREVASKYDGATPEEGVQKLMEAAMGYDGLGASEIIKILKEEGSGIMYAEDSNGDLASSEIIRQAIEATGFDGIVDTLVNQKFGSQKRIGKAMAGMEQGTVHTIAFNSNQIKSANPFTYDDAGALIPLSERFQPSEPDIRRMAVEAEPRTEQVAGRTDRGTPIITTPVGIIKQTNEVLRKNFFDGTTVSNKATKNAWLYISRLLDIESGAANELAGQINDTVDVETNSDSRMGASLFSVSLANYAAKLAALGDSTMLSFLVRRINKMPVDKYAGGRSEAGEALRGAREYDIDGYGALKVEQQAKRDRTAAEIFARANPTEQQVKDVSDAIDAADNATIGTPEEVASDVEQIEKRTKRNITKKLETLLKKGSLKEMIASIKNTPLEEQQAPGWIEKVIKAYLEQAGLTGDAATTAAKLYDSILTERFVAAKQKAFEETLKRSAPWNNYLSRNSRMAKDSLKKIQVAIRTGVLDPSQTIESVIAKENGWDGFTKEQFEKIVQLDNIINNPDNDDVTRREAMSELNKVIVDAKLPVRFKDALGAYYVGNALMGIPTVTVNIASPIGFTVRNLMTDIGRYAFTDPARIPIAFESFLDSMRSWYDQTSYAFKNQIYLNDVVEYLQGQNVLRELFDKGKKQWANGEYAAGFVNMAVGMTQITGRVLSSLDQGAIAMLENQNITRYAMEALAANTKGRVPKDKLKEFANMVLDTKRRVIAESVASGMPRDRAGVLADLAVKSEVISALASQDANPRAVLDASINDALLSVGRNKAITIKGAEKENTNLSDEGMLSYLPISFLQTIASGAARQGSGMQIFSKMLYGFALVPARVFHNVAWFSPYGFIRLGVDKYKKSKGQDSPYAMSLQTDAQFKQRLTEAIAGSIVMLGLAALRAGSSDDEDDKQFKIVITGNGPSATTDRQYYDSWNKKWKPYSIHIVVGDTIIPINIGRGGEALFFPIMLAGAMDDWEIKKKQNDTKKEPEDLSAMASMLGSSFFALAQRGPYAAFTKPLFDASKDGRVTEELASQAGYFGKTFIPFLGTSVARNITDFINDPVDRSSVEGAIYANTPIVGPWMGAKALNALGQPIRADDWGDKLFKLGVPVVFSFPKDTPMNELNELILKQGSGPSIPTRTNAQKRFGDILTDDEFESYVREYGKVMSDRMFKNRTKLARMKPSDYDDELEKYARGYSAGDFKIKGASDAAVQAVKRMRQ